MTYVCPMHPEVRSETPGTCPKCGGMKLVPEEKAHLGHGAADESFFSTYKPLLVIVGLILLASVVSTLAGGGDWREGMLSFMAGFFLVFAGLKLLDVPGFAKGYATYDLLAARVPAYGYVYPFLELALGLLYLARYELDAVNVAAVVSHALQRPRRGDQPGEREKIPVRVPRNDDQSAAHESDAYRRFRDGRDGARHALGITGSPLPSCIRSILRACASIASSPRPSSLTPC
jgi:hypothetical protein